MWLDIWNTSFVIRVFEIFSVFNMKCWLVHVVVLIARFCFADQVIDVWISNYPEWANTLLQTNMD